MVSELPHNITRGNDKERKKDNNIERLLVNASIRIYNQAGHEIIIGQMTHSLKLKLSSTGWILLFGSYSYALET